MGSYGDQWMQCTRCDWWGKCTGHVTEDCTLYVADVDCATDKAPLLLCSWCIDDKMLVKFMYIIYSFGRMQYL